MNEATIRQELAEATKRVATLDHERLKIDQERKALSTMIEGFNSWLQLFGTQPPLAAVKNPVHHFEAKGTMSMRAGVLKVLQDANGESLSLKTILERVLAIGVRTSAADPLILIENNAIALKKEGKAEKTAPRIYRATRA